MTQQEFFDPVEGTSEPDRFWTTTNVSEATPDLLSPLCWSVWSDGLERSWLQSMFDFGLLARSETALNDDPNRRSTAAIYGRQAANVDVIRNVMGRLPGVNPDDVERDLLGSVRPGLPPEQGAGLRLPIVLVKLPWVMLRTSRLVQRLHEDNRRWWREEVATERPDLSPIVRLQTAAERFAEAMNVHARVRFLIPIAEQMLTSVAQRAGVADVQSLVGGLGDVAETALADDLWRVSRGELSLQEFIDEFGFHGPNEGNVYTRSWREQPEKVASMVASYRARDDLRRPRELELAAMRAKESATREALRGAPAVLCPVLRFALRRLDNTTRNLELTKAAYLRALDGARAAARSLGAQLTARGIIAEPDDAFFLTVAEHRRIALGGGSDDTQQLVTYRRAQRERYAAHELPVSFTGMPNLQELTGHDVGAEATEITGVAGGCGVAEGRARVILDATDDVDLDPGDILVCRCTDPSWAPLFVCASALVIDIGTAVSHGAVVARELGIPYVIGTGNGTRAIRDGEIIHVDGNERRVSIVAAR